TAYCGVIALILLAVIYVGLIYLGSSVSSYYPKDIERSQLLLGIAERVLGKNGMLFLSIAVVLACVTTAIGQITSIANFFHDFSNGKIPHKLAALVFAILGATIAVLGVEKIIYFATPIYKGVYPSLIVLMILGIFRKFIPNKQSFRYALIFTLAVSILEAILSVADVAIIKAFVDILP
ncbi:branched-chain amino acid transport system II carrier protein, partial [Salmonella enterica subsp. enterica serovar Tamberma]|nr:branched-chain amino acid transport system II carrier protein [Salmonella enterica subsp. enterica serovar Tamberma]